MAPKRSKAVLSAGPSVVRDVSCRAFPHLFEELPKKGLAPDALGRGVPFPVEHLLDPDEWIDWSSFVRLLRNAGRIWSDAELVRMAGAALRSRPMRWIGVAARLLRSPLAFYRSYPRIIQGHIRCARASLREVGPNRLVCELSVSRDRDPCHEFLVAQTGVLAALSALLGRPEALVDFKEQGNGARYEILVPPARRRTVFALNLLLRPDAARRAAAELWDAHQSLWAKCAALHREIARRERTESELARSEETFRALVDNLSQVAWLVDLRDPQASYLSPVFERVFGLKRGERSSNVTAWLDLVHPEDRARIARRIGAPAGGAPFDDQYRILLPDGSIRWIRDHGVPLRDEQGRVVRLVGFTEDVTERRREEEELRESEQRLRDLAARLTAVREEERASVAREIHDGLGQSLTALKLHLARETAGFPRRVEEAVGTILGEVDAVLAAARDLAARLRPAVLDELGLGAAIEWELARFEERTGIRAEVDLAAGPAAERERERDTAAYRILQEAITNVARHAGATRVSIRLAASGGELALRVEDDGCGISDEQVESARSLGLVGMRERAAALGGEVRIAAAEAGGTVVELRLPLARGGAGPEPRARSG